MYPSVCWDGLYVNNIGNLLLPKKKCSFFLSKWNTILKRLIKVKQLWVWKLKFKSIVIQETNLFFQHDIYTFEFQIDRLGQVYFCTFGEKNLPRTSLFQPLHLLNILEFSSNFLIWTVNIQRQSNSLLKNYRIFQLPHLFESQVYVYMYLSLYLFFFI